jgi:hypothetical protein
MNNLELEAILSNNEEEAVSMVKQSLFLWGIGLIIICGNLIFNPLWEGHWLSKIWLPAVYVAALVLLAVSKYNHRTEAGRIVFETDWIRIFPKDVESKAFRISELQDLSIESVSSGFFRNPFQMKSFGIIRFRFSEQWYEYHFRLLRTKDESMLQTIKIRWNN